MSNLFIVRISNDLEEVAQQIVLVWRQGDTYGDEIMNRVINSIELKKPEK